jgi:8-oxo-dGTP pyrophosphatase MutT (NUDIX family)
MKARNTAIPAAYVIFAQDGKVLLARRSNTGYQDGNYQVPAGHVEDRELPSETAVREAEEEVGAKISPSDLRLVHVSYRPRHDGTDDRVDFFFRCERWEGEIVNAEPEKCDELRWVDPSELPPNTTPHVRDAIQSMVAGTLFRELDDKFLKENGVYQLAE